MGTLLGGEGAVSFLGGEGIGGADDEGVAPGAGGGEGGGDGGWWGGDGGCGGAADRWRWLAMVWER